MSNLSSSQDQCPEITGIPVIPPIVFFSSLLAGGLAEAALPTNLELPATASIASGFVLFACGFAAMYVGYRAFKAAGTSERITDPATALVTNGIYTRSRNPMYLGFVLMGIALALAFQSLWLLGSSGVIWLYLACIVIPREEHYLSQRFGDSYLQFKQRTRRWV